jgi:hypothetical protein
VSKFDAEKSLQEVHEDGMQDTDKKEWKAQNNVLRTAIWNRMSIRVYTPVLKQ